MKPPRKPVIVSLGVAAAVLAAAGAADLTLAHVARHRVEKAVACRLHPTGPVGADLESTFAGLRAVSGDLGTVHVTADGVKRAGTDLNVSADLRHVTRKGTRGGTATAVVPYTELRKRLGGDGAFTFGSDGSDLVLTGTVGSLGLPVTVRTATTTTRNSVTVTPTTVGVLGRDIPVADLSGTGMGSGLSDRLKPHTVSLAHLPAGASVVSASAGHDGLAVHLSLSPMSARTGGNAPRCV
ncbi:LmeA family phospholipid-binding protein [Actinacidiphila acididurans]|uniref:LmeA family phospholipid-binding protein n=1 Tax=Actinacidiphila acididurans TaxID=2784346 RepID=A0ABS2TVH0_9ACTN|nr:LmeA family phospholipid-binding protein [Actinacidiphila acididurans]MBM9507343.1 LmeA family phospholipid-binding protein [Actinacidiphila acididurans]